MDLMRREFISIPAEETLAEARRTMQLARLRHLCVVTDGETLVGLVSYRDLLDRLLDHLIENVGGFGEGTLREAMVPAPYVARPETPVDEAARRMLRLRLGCLPVCERGEGVERLVGLLAEGDLLRAAWER